MKKFHVPIRNVLIRGVVGIGVCTACVLAFMPWAGAANDAVLVSVDTDAPLRATLMPSVVVSASASRPGHVTMQVGDDAPLAVTLMPTVRVGMRQ